MARIFISYRRDDTEMVAGRLAKDLRARFGDDTVFRDKESIPVGADWAQEINHAIGKGGVVLVLIGEDWLEGKAKGQRRLDDPQDPHRNEVSAALRLGATVVPILVRNVRMPPKEELPDDLQRLPALNAMKLRDDEWEGFDFPRLAGVLEKCGFKPVQANRDSAKAATQPERAPGKLPTSAKSIWAIVLGMLALGGGAASNSGDAGFALFVAIMASLLGFFGFRDARAGRVKGERVAIAGMIAGGVGTLLALVALGRPANQPAAPIAFPTTPAVTALTPQVTPAPPPAVIEPETPPVARKNSVRRPAVNTPTPVHEDGDTLDPQPPINAHNLSGGWTDAEDGTRVEMQHEGVVLSAATVQDGIQVGGVGTVTGNNVEIVWAAAGVVLASSRLQVSQDGRELRGTSVAINGQSATTVFRR